ncbi:transposase domain-containing protein [Streptosporangium amethystogenes]|uniref:transposase domain-containing protein n=1 Tax=Streptosporangium amethystogenes TaxID=2002 RepID=UPI0037B8A115
MKTEPVNGRLADHLAIGILTSAFPVPLLDEVVLASGCADQRRRALPARLTIYYVLALCMFPDRNYDEIMRLLLNGLSWRSHWAKSWEVPSVSAISRARARLGAEPLRVLFRRVAVPLPEPGATGSRLAGLRPVTMDGTALTVPETRDNAAFGYPDESARLPCVRVVAVVDGGTHALIDATIGGSGAGRQALSPRLLRRLEPGVLLLAGPGARGAELWRQAAGTGTHLLWRTGKAGRFPVARRLGDGSFLSRPPGWADALLRVIPLPGTERLVTTLLDPGRAPAPELVARYAERWVMDGALAWLRSDRSGAVVALRSRTPETVAQEIWALLCLYQAARALTCRGAGRAWVWPASRVRTGRRAEGVTGAESLGIA